MKNGNSVWYMIKKTFEYDKFYWIIQLINAMTMTLQVYILAYIPKFIIRNKENVQYTDCIRQLILLILMVVACNFLIVECTRQKNWRSMALLHRFVEEKVSVCYNIDYQKYETAEVKDIVEKAHQATYQSTHYGIYGFYTTVNFICGNTGVIIISVIQVGKVTPILLIILGLLGYVAFKTLDKMKVIDKRKYWDAIAKYERRLKYLYKVSTDVKFAKDIRLFNEKEWIQKKNEDTNSVAYNLSKMHYLRWVNCEVIMNICKMIQEIIIYGWLVYWLVTNRMDIGDFSFYLLILQTFSRNILQFFDQVSVVKKLSSEIDDYRTLLAMGMQKEEDKDIEKKSEYPIELRNVWFKYEGSEQYILKNINIKIKENNTLAIVGLNGAGKSTLIKLLCGLYHPTKGQILYYGNDIQMIDQKQYFNNIAPVFQKIACFPTLLKENISMKAENETKNDIVMANLEKVGLSSKVKTLKKGIDTEISKVFDKEGIELSGGEQQKMLLARVLYKGGEITILDEPTAAMDPIAEENTYKMIANNCDDVIIYVSHRMSSTRFCDWVVVLNDGTICEQGTSEELLKKQGLYTRLYNSQANFYKKHAKAESVIGREEMCLAEKV